MADTVSPPSDIAEKRRAARLAAFCAAVAEAAPWYAGGLPPDQPWAS